MVATARSSEGHFVVERKELELPLVLFVFTVDLELLDDVVLVTVPNQLADFIEGFVDGESLLRRPIVGDERGEPSGAPL